MRGVFGIVGLLIAVAIAGSLGLRAWRSAQAVAPAAAAASSIATGDARVVLPEHARPLEQAVTSEVTRALEQGAARHDDSAR